MSEQPGGRRRALKADRLRIAQVASIASAVGPQSASSIEQLVWLLTEELVRRGHAVTLCATRDSQTSAALHAVYAHGYEEDPDLWNWQVHETLHMASVFERARDFDVIHSHVYHYALPFIRLGATPVVHTYHILPDPDVVRAYTRYPEAHVVALSHYQRSLYQDIPDMAVVHHGIDTETFPCGEGSGGYLLFLGRMLPDKGVVEAIQLARQVGMRLVLAGPHDADPDYFRSRVAPLVDGRDVRYVGPVGAAERNRLLVAAAALIYPIREPEPFGLVLIEAMACGTPVLACGLGAVPEIVENGVTGFYARDLQALAGLVPDVLALDRARVRREAVAHFDYRRMVDGYEAVYERLAAGAGGRAPAASGAPRVWSRARPS
jgi:glycosyltransferase involved in cell wall biosynthesis